MFYMLQNNETAIFYSKVVMKMVEWIFLFSGGMTAAYMAKLLIALFVEKNTNKEEKGFFNFIKRIFGIGTVKESRYVLSDYINLEVKNQMQTSSCWAFSILSSMETNMALRNNEYKQFSERHMVYATSRRFIDGVNYNGFNKQAKDNGLHEIGLAYLTNGQGAVLEQDMPFENNEKPLYISEIDIIKFLMGNR